MKHYIYGAGGHGKVVLDAMQLAGVTCTGFVDDKHDSVWAGLSVQSFSNLNINNVLSLHMAIGDCKVREAVVAKLSTLSFFNVFHPDSTISKMAEIGIGSFIAAQAVLAPDAKVGQHCIVNHSAIVDHDCIVGDFGHVAPQASLGGASKIGKGVLVGAGAVVMPSITIGDYAIIGAGAVVTKNVAAGTVVIGNPAREIN